MRKLCLYSPLTPLFFHPWRTSCRGLSAFSHLTPHGRPSSSSLHVFCVIKLVHPCSTAHSHFLCPDVLQTHTCTADPHLFCTLVLQTHTCEEVMMKMERWISEHRKDPSRSRLRRLVPQVWGGIHTLYSHVCNKTSASGV